MKPTLSLLLVTAGLVLGTPGLRADGKPDDAGKPEDAGKPANPGSQGAVHGKGSAESALVRGLLDDFATKREAYIAHRKALVESLKNAATDAERKAILASLREEQQARIDEQRALAKTIRDDLKNLRKDRKAGSGG